MQKKPEKIKIKSFKILTIIKKNKTKILILIHEEGNFQNGKKQ